MLTTAKSKKANVSSVSPSSEWAAFRKTLEQKFIFQIGTLNPHGINEHFSSAFLLFTEVNLRFNSIVNAKLPEVEQVYTSLPQYLFAYHKIILDLIFRWLQYVSGERNR